MSRRLDVAEGVRAGLTLLLQGALTIYVCLPLGKPRMDAHEASISVTTPGQPWTCASGR